jgi:hemoglobin
MLVTTFYAKIKRDDVLGPIFRAQIHDWKAHILHLTDFWESSLFFVNKYSGNPIEKHIEVDTAFDQILNEQHFGIWLNYWIQTLDELFEGEKVSIAKNRARKMSTFMYVKLFEARKQDKNTSA